MSTYYDPQTTALAIGYALAVPIVVNFIARFLLKAVTQWRQ